tara:strand:+ start:14754 stop:15788 length:1035 start_codon:yes stop_codon:yes gene_type:complete
MCVEYTFAEDASRAELKAPIYMSNEQTKADTLLKDENVLIDTSELYLQWLDSTRAELSSNVVDIGTYIDSLMGDVDGAQDKNKSYLKIVLGTYNSKNTKTEFESRVRFSLDLPLIKEKFRLVFETEPDQAKEIDERKLASFPSSDQNENKDDIYASFRYLIDAEKWSRLSWDTGVKVRLRSDLFTRGRAVRTWSINDYWTLRFSQELFWFESRGLGTQTQFDFDRRLNERFLLRKSIYLDWSERQSRFDLLNQVSLFHTLSEKRSMQYALGFTSDHLDNHSRVNNYFGRIIFRSSLYKNWLFYQVESGVEYPREEGFRANPFVGLKLEILFADDAEKQLSARLD